MKEISVVSSCAKTFIHVNTNNVKSNFLVIFCLMCYNGLGYGLWESERSLDVGKEKRGLFGGGTELRNEWRRDQFTREGTRNLGGATDDEGKLTAKKVECIVADAGARSQGAMAGSAIAAGVAVPALASIPYVGWLAGGWALLLGQKAGSSLGSQVGSVFNDC